jgi:hypothetical protein
VYEHEISKEFIVAEKAVQTNNFTISCSSELSPNQISIDAST